jgi:hypothetical protein
VQARRVHSPANAPPPQDFVENGQNICEPDAAVLKDTFGVLRDDDVAEVRPRTARRHSSGALLPAELNFHQQNDGSCCGHHVPSLWAVYAGKPAGTVPLWATSNERLVAFDSTRSRVRNRNRGSEQTYSPTPSHMRHICR